MWVSVLPLGSRGLLTQVRKRWVPSPGEGKALAHSLHGLRQTPGAGRLTTQLLSSSVPPLLVSSKNDPWLGLVSFF